LESENIGPFQGGVTFTVGCVIKNYLESRVRCWASCKARRKRRSDFLRESAKFLLLTKWQPYCRKSQKNTTVI